MAGEYFTGNAVVWNAQRSVWQGFLSYKDAQGRRKQKSKTFPECGHSPKSGKRQAQALFQEWKEELNRKALAVSPQELVKPKSMKTVGERVNEYFKTLEEMVSRGELQQSTLTAKQQSANLYILPNDIATKPYQALSKDDIVEWERRLHEERGIANSTIGVAHSILRRIYNYDLERGQVEETPFRFLRSPKAEKRNVNYATQDAVRKLDTVLGIRWQENPGDADILCYYLALYTGMRGQEVCGLRWKDIYEPQGVITVRCAIARNGGEPYAKEPKTKESERIIPIMPALLPLLEDRRKRVCLEERVDEPKGDWYVVGVRDRFKNPQNVTGNFGRFCRRNNILGSEGEYLKFHGLRDTFATVAVQGKAIDIKTLSALLGHTNTQMTLSRYVGLGDDGIRRQGMEQIGNAFERILDSDD